MCMGVKHAVVLKNVSKTYPLKRKNGPNTINTVLDDFSISIEKGEIVGIIGRNGCGKSTLLAIIAKITHPDSGEVHNYGKTAAILELGLGFHMDFSGRDNIYLTGELFGLTRKQIDEKIEKIIEYADLFDYIDNPVRTYSSGMKSRLAFSIIMNVDSDILLIDEVLSVGDAVFIQKAKNYFDNLVKSGKTILLVSHSLDAITNMCTRAIWIERGRIKKDGDPGTVCREYTTALSQDVNILEELAELNDPRSLYNLAMRYKEDNNREKYQQFMKKSVEQNYTPALIDYSDYLIETGNIQEATLYLEELSRQNNTQARVKLAELKGGYAHFKTGILQQIRKRAECGSIPDMFKLCHEELRSQKWNLRSEYEYWLEKAADAGHTAAQYRFGINRLEKTNNATETEKFIAIIKKSAEKYYLPALSFLSDCYSVGKYVEKDLGKASMLCEMAATWGHIPSQYNIAYNYEHGIGVEENPTKAKKWYTIYTHSINQSTHTLTKQNIEQIFKMDALQQKELIECCRYQNNFVATSNVIDVLSKQAEHYESDIEFCIETLKIMSIQGNSNATEKLGDLFFRGIGVEACSEYGFEWYQKAGIQGNYNSLKKVIEYYVKNNAEIETIEKYIHKCMPYCLTESILSLCELYWDAKTTDTDQKMIELLEEYEKLNEPKILLWLSRLYRTGRGVDKDLCKALNYAKSANSLNPGLGDIDMINICYLIKDDR